MRLAKVLDVLVDFLLGERANTSYDKEKIERLEAFENIPQKEKD